MQSLLIVELLIFSKCLADKTEKEQNLRHKIARAFELMLELTNVTKQTREKSSQTNEQICSDDETRTPSKMDGERAIICNCVITALFVPCVVIAVVATLIYVVKACLCVVEKLCAYIQREFDLFNEIHEDNQAPVWDEGDLFVSFIKGEDVQDRLQKKNTLRPKAEKDTKVTITERIYSGIAMASTVKHPMNGDIFIRDLILKRPCTHLRTYPGIRRKSTLPYVRRNQNCTRIGASTLSHLIHPVTSDVVTDANLLHAVKGNKDHGHENMMVSLCANREDHCQVADASSEVNLQQGRSVPRSRIPVLSAQNSEEKQVNLSQDIERPSFRADKKKKNGKTSKIACSNQVGREQSKKVKPQEINRSLSMLRKGRK